MGEEQSMCKLEEKFEFRNIKQEEADQAVKIEEICFPPEEACSEKMMRERVKYASELFLVILTILINCRQFFQKWVHFFSKMYYTES